MVVKIVIAASRRKHASRKEKLLTGANTGRVSLVCRGPQRRELAIAFGFHTPSEATLPVRLR